MSEKDYNSSSDNSPSPRLSPAGRGRNARRVLANPALTSARSFSNFKKLPNSCSLSQRERVRVRENAPIFYWSAGLRSRCGVLDCGGIPTRRDTPLSGAPQAKIFSGGFVRAKAVSPLRSATALQDVADARFTHHSSLVTL